MCDRKYDVIAMTDADGILKERTDYSPYGVARQRPPADLNGDGKIDGVDQLIFFNAWGAAIGAAAYNPDADINSDGAVNGSDFLILSNNFGADPAPPGAISKLGNTVGYSGYIYDDAIGLSLARFRWYDAETGRWATRDPVEYLDGSSLYLYVKASPIKLYDPYGLSAECSSGITNDDEPISPRDQKRCCQKAYSPGDGEILDGKVTCCKGKKQICMYWHPDSRRGHRPEPAPNWRPAEKAIWNCIRRHEEEHFNNHTAPNGCKGKQDGGNPDPAPGLTPNDKPKWECLAYIVQRSCVESAARQECETLDPGPAEACRRRLEREMDRVSDSIKSYCSEHNKNKPHDRIDFNILLPPGAIR